MPDAKQFLRQRLAERRRTPFIPIALFGLPEFEPQPLPSLTPRGLQTAGEVDSSPASPASFPEA
jgi:hypothetical protein